MNIGSSFTDLLIFYELKIIILQKFHKSSLKIKISLSCLCFTWNLIIKTFKDIFKVNSYVSLSILTNYVSLSILTNYVSLSILTNYVSLSILTNYVSLSILTNYVSLSMLTNTIYKLFWIIIFKYASKIKSFIWNFFIF